MIQHRGSLNNFFINNAYKLKNKQGVARPHLVLSLKKRLCLRLKSQVTKEPHKIDYDIFSGGPLDRGFK